MFSLILTRNDCDKVSSNGNIIFQIFAHFAGFVAIHLLPLHFIGYSHHILEIFISTPLKVLSHIPEMLISLSSSLSLCFYWYTKSSSLLLFLIIFKAFSKCTNPTVSTKKCEGFSHQYL